MSARMPERMKSLDHGENNALMIVGPLLHSDLYEIEEGFYRAGFVLPALYDAGGLIPDLRATAGQATEVTDPEWQGVLDELDTTVQKIKEVVLHPNFGPHRLERVDMAFKLPEDRPEKATDLAEYRFLSRQALKYIAEAAPDQERRPRDWSILSLLLLFEGKSRDHSVRAIEAPLRDLPVYEPEPRSVEPLVLVGAAS